MVRIKPKTETLVPNNRLALDTLADTKEGLGAYRDLLVVIADVYDLAAAGQDAWMALGSTTDKSSLTLTVTVDGARQTLYQTSLAELALAAQSLL